MGYLVDGCFELGWESQIHDFQKIANGGHLEWLSRVFCLSPLSSFLGGGLQGFLMPSAFKMPASKVPSAPKHFRTEKSYSGIF